MADLQVDDLERKMGTVAGVLKAALGPSGVFDSNQFVRVYDVLYPDDRPEKQKHGKHSLDHYLKGMLSSYVTKYPGRFSPFGPQIAYQDQDASPITYRFI